MLKIGNYEMQALTVVAVKHVTHVVWTAIYFEGRCNRMAEETVRDTLQWNGHQLWSTVRHDDQPVNELVKR